MMTQQYYVTKFFIGGMLEGMTHSEITTVRYEVGFECKKPVGGSPYRIESVTPLSAEAAAMLKAAQQFRKGA